MPEEAVTVREGSDGWFIEHNGHRDGPLPESQARSRAQGLARKFGVDLQVESAAIADGGER